MSSYIVIGAGSVQDRCTDVGLQSFAWTRAAIRSTRSHRWPACPSICSLFPVFRHYTGIRLVVSPVRLSTIASRRIGLPRLSATNVQWPVTYPEFRCPHTASGWKLLFSKSFTAISCIFCTHPVTTAQRGSYCYQYSLSVCLSVNTITPEPLEILSRNFQGCILWSKGRTSSNMSI